MPIEQVRKPQKDQEDDKVTMDFLLKQYKMQCLIADRKKAQIKLKFIRRQLDCAVQNRARAFRRVEYAEYNMRVNTSNAQLELESAYNELELRNRELEMAIDKEYSINNLIHDLSDQFDKLNGKGEPRELFDEVLVDLHKIFEEKQRSQLKFQF